MVRLKGEVFIKFAQAEWVSIPYGSIKRECDVRCLAEDMGFQFLMVRLKVYGESIVDGELFSFNSLWFD